MGKEINRRTFLKTSALAGVAGMTAAFSRDLFAAKKRKNAMPEVERKEQIANFSFNANGKFKILQLTDTHYVSGNPKSERARKNVLEMLDKEKPDLVIHTGDVIYGKPAEASLREVLGLIADRKIPFLVTLGNHDGQFDLSRKAVFDVIKTIPYNKNKGVEGLYGDSNDLITLSGSKDKALRWAFYLFDSGNRISLKGKGLEQRGAYDYIHFDQIAWYRKHSLEFATQNGGKPLPSLAFFHIPVPEYAYAIHNDVRRVMKGNFGEEPYPPMVNSGLWTSMREMGDVQATFVGHDHDNDYAMSWNETFLCYGRFSGCDTVYNDLKPSGARVIELTEGEAGFRSWVRVYGEGVTQNYKFPEDFKTSL